MVIPIIISLGSTLIRLLSKLPPMNTRTVKIPGLLYRQFDVELEERAEPVEGEQRLYPLSFSSEQPVRRYDWATETWYDEVLSHEPQDIDLSRAQSGLPLLKCHSRFDHFGSVNEVSVDAERKRLRGLASFSSIPLGQEQETLLREGHTKSVSTGYRVMKMDLVSRSEDGIPTYRCRWMPMEVSTEPIPADPKVGFGRATDETMIELEVEDPADQSEGERNMEPEVVQTPPTPVVGTPIASGRDLRAEALEIAKLAEAYKQTERVADWLQRGLTVSQVQREILDSWATKARSQPSSEQIDAVMSKKDRSRYSMARAIQMQVEMVDGSRRTGYDGLEGEVHQELSRNGAPAHGGIKVPWRTRTMDDVYQRTMGTGEATGGAALVGQQVIPDLIELLRNRAVVLVAGAKLYPNLQGNIFFAKETADPTVYWMGENPATAVTGSNPTTGYVQGTPKTLMGSVQIPRQLLVQSSIDVEADVRNKLAIGHGLAIDLAALHGKGTDKQPVGVYSAADVQYWGCGGVPDLTDITTMMGLLATANAWAGGVSWITTPGMATKLMGTPVVSGFPQFIWEGDFLEGKLFGVTARSTSQMSATLGNGANEHGLVVANWNDLAVCMWGNEIEIVVDIYTRAGYGQIVVTSYSMADVLVLRPASFCKGTGATIS